MKDTPVLEMFRTEAQVMGGTPRSRYEPFKDMLENLGETPFERQHRMADIYRMANSKPSF